ncbi:MAG: hypothetical protein M1829_003228 [Trizodia sp. TS-e1964]|nr:MAG: hypothetical protein M1829_003228 [Trizodia sp. TS-e1964]
MGVVNGPSNKNAVKTPAPPRSKITTAAVPDAADGKMSDAFHSAPEELTRLIGVEGIKNCPPSLSQTPSALSPKKRSFSKIGSESPPHIGQQHGSESIPSQFDRIPPRKRLSRGLSISGDFMAFTALEPRADNQTQTYTQPADPTTNNEEADAEGGGEAHEKSSSDGDDGYRGVDLISDSGEESDPDLEVAEEQAIIESEDEHDREYGIYESTIMFPSSPYQSDNIPDDSHSHIDMGFGFNDVTHSAEIPFLEQKSGRENPNMEYEAELYSAASAMARNQMRPPRQVRFKDNPVSSTSTSAAVSDDDEDDFGFPDFLGVDELDPDFKRLLENDQDLDDNASEGSSILWCLDREEPLPLPNIVACRSYDSTSDSSSGYETDEGETTEEDLPPERTIMRSRSILRRPSPVTNRKSGASAKSRAGASTGPRLASWVTDASKPFAVMDVSGRHLVIVPARKRPAEKEPRSPSESPVAVNSSQAPQMPLTDESDNDRSDFSIKEPMIGARANLMLAGSPYVRGGQVLGPPEAFFPFKSIGHDGRVQEDEDIYDDDDEEDDLDIHEFIDLGEGESSDEAETEWPSLLATP